MHIVGLFQYIVTTLKNLNWFIKTDTFENETPIGTRKFENIIATLNQNADRYLTLACHYDSKYFTDFEFVGATDSAVPCMQLINLAKVMKKYLKTIKNVNSTIIVAM